MNNIKTYQDFIFEMKSEKDIVKDLARHLSFDKDVIKYLNTSRAKRTMGWRELLDDKLHGKNKDYINYYDLNKDRIDIMSILGILPEKPFQPKKLSLEISVEENAKLIRKSLGITACGPVYAITNTFETIGIIVLTFDCPDEIEGLNGTVNGIPYIFFNSNKTIERQRFTLMHEFCHLFFNHINAEGKEFEKYISNLAGNVLISNDDLYRKFGKVNRNITTYLRDYVAKEYKIAPSCLITRLHEAGVITDRYYTTFFKLLNSSLGKTHEKSLLSKTDNELPTAFTQQVYLALSKQLITASKASEVLNVPLYNVMNNMRA